MRAAVYNAHWPTLGGGELQASGVAVALALDHDVELLVNEEFDAVGASDRLGVDLTGFPQREVPMGTRGFLDVTAEYDLLVNSSFTSINPSRARASAYYVQFPVPFPHQSWTKRAGQAATEVYPYAGSVERQHGFWMDEFRSHGAWTKDVARIDLVIPRDLVLPFSCTLDARSWPPGRVPHVEVVIGDEVVFSGVLDSRRPQRVRAQVRGRGVADPVPVWLRSDTFVPRLELGTDDDRLLGVIVSHARLGAPFARMRAGYLRTGPSAVERNVAEFLDTYQLVAANSEYTAGWVERLWGRRATVLSPPVHMREPGTKRPVILAVGRFFPNISGHSKKQLELVHAFRAACERGLDGWELHLVGGCKNEERRYVEDVRRAAVGLPVEFHVNAPGDDVADLFATARLFWHAAGLGEDLGRRPDRAEHFGITVVEAMSAGAVPFVYEQGGPAAIVRAHGCGEVYSTIDELATATLRLTRAPRELDRLADAARAAARDFGFDRFVERARALFATTGSLHA